VAVRPLVLRGLVAVVILNATAGIVAIVATSSKQQFGDFEARLLASALIISLGVIALLPAVLAAEGRTLGRRPVVPAISAGLTTLGCVLVIYALWQKIDDSSFWRPTGTLIVIGLVLAHTCLLSLARLPRRYEWLRLSAIGLAILAAGEIVAIIWDNDPPEDLWRAFGISGILMLAASFLVPIVQRGVAAPATGVLTDVLYCPYCGARLARETGCARCGARFRVERT
jgi:hypothetical protein